MIDPETFRTVRTIEVCTDRSRVPYINELEWIDGELWANVYTTDTVIRIDPRTGAVVGVIDLAGLLSPADVTAQTDVLNGIAYDAKTGRIFVTGKNWNKLFEIVPRQTVTPDRGTLRGRSGTIRTLFTAHVEIFYIRSALAPHPGAGRRAGDDDTGLRPRRGGLSGRALRRLGGAAQGV